MVTGDSAEEAEEREKAADQTINDGHLCILPLERVTLRSLNRFCKLTNVNVKKSRQWVDTPQLVH